jgi:hypothetical protein
VEGRRWNFAHADLALDGLRLISSCGFERGLYGGIAQQRRWILRQGNGGEQKEEIISHVLIIA